MHTLIKPTTESQKLALTSFFKTMNGYLWRVNNNWLKGDPCQNFWHGIQCNIYGNIITMVFGENKMRGILPTEIVNLKDLEEFILYNEYDTYSEYHNRLFVIEKRINELFSLKTLILRNLNITDSLVSSLYSFNRLEILDLSYNKIEGTLTNTITNLRVLKRLHLANNKISGSLNSFNGFSGKLEVIELQNNILSSNIPSLDNLSQTLRVLDIRNNDMFGGIPNNYFNDKVFPKFIYMGVMLNPRLVVPKNCERQPFCFSSNFYNFRDAGDLNYSMNQDDKMYLKPVP